MLSMYFAAGHMRYERCDASLLSWPSPLVIACLISMKFDELNPQTSHLVWRVHVGKVLRATKGFASKRVLQKSNFPATPTYPESTPDLTPDRFLRVWTCISICPTAAMFGSKIKVSRRYSSNSCHSRPSRP